MRILFFFGGSYISGLEVVNFHLLEELKKSGAQIHCIVSGWNNGEVETRLSNMGIPYTAVKLGWLYIIQPKWTIDTLRHLPRARRQIRRIVSGFDPDVVHFCNFGNVLMTAGLRLPPAVYNLQEPHQPTKKHRWIYKRLNSRISRFTTVSEAIVEKYKALQIPTEKIALVYNGIPPVAPLPTTPHTPFAFGVIGQVVRWKGHEVVVRAVERLRQKGLPPFIVCLFGNDKTAFAKEMKSLITSLHLDSYFEWRGFVTDQESIYKAVDSVVVMSYSEEPCSLTIIESLWRQKPVIASDRGGNPELIDDGVNGLLCEAGNAIQLAAAMERLMTSEEERIQLSVAARQKAEVHFIASRMAAQYNEIYSQVISNNTRREAH